MACIYEEERKPDYSLARAAMKHSWDSKRVPPITRRDVDIRNCPLGISQQYSPELDSRAREIFWKVYGGDDDAAFDAIATISMASPEVKGLVLQMLQLIQQADSEEIAVICHLIDYLRNLRTEVTVVPD